MLFYIVEIILHGFNHKPVCGGKIPAMVIINLVGIITGDCVRCGGGNSVW